ncbi:Predicted membrane protein [Acholeplasma oculi]|uniref:ECF transporter, substrate-specific component n=1 Tax=Acholeplasma oculi TaxID=35623 RepID=A0A061AFR0_9MOLU|nr:folate family ECF transporter S component [Acholeplasma oculi]CDR30401.1 ECF transporter, substrate-specific component [Acholeplasma oculi]SKC41709.1 ECF transporter S component, folate family [Acholeplasma oculi]SUT88946.1 Predicted membrane protein [Acholeplasma oculi]
MVQKTLRKLTLAAILTAISIVLDIVFKTIVPQGISFGFPFYSIPLVIGSIVLGPIYGGMMGFLSDAIGFYASASTYPFDILFSLQAMSWGVIPFFIAKRHSKWWVILIAITITHITATSLSTFANFMSSYAFNGGDINAALIYAFKNVPLRLLMMPVNIIVITYVTTIMNRRLEPLYVEFFQDKKILNT